MKLLVPVLLLPLIFTSCASSSSRELATARSSFYNLAEAKMVIACKVDARLDLSKSFDAANRVKVWNKPGSADPTPEDHERLNGGVARILQKGTTSAEQLLAEVREILVREIWCNV